MGIVNEFADSILKKTDGLGILHSNQAINKIGKFVGGETADVGLRGVLKGVSEGTNLKSIAKNAYFNGEDIALKNANWKAIGGTYIGASVAGRVATGGGLYKDRTGKTNIPVVPFV